MSSPSPHAFTIASEGTNFRQLITDVLVSGFKIPGHPIFKVKKEKSVKALWDTGATDCCITPNLAAELGLVPVGMTNVHHADGESQNKNVYFMSITLPGGVMFPRIRVVEFDSASGEFDMLIGMSVICNGDFSVTRKEGKNIFTFRIPSCHSLDYVEESKGHIKKQHTPIVAEEKQKPNDQCACGSKKKYKKCHGA